MQSIGLFVIFDTEISLEDSKLVKSKSFNMD